MSEAGYKISLQMFRCDVEVALHRNASRGDDNICCYYADTGVSRETPVSRLRVQAAVGASLKPEDER